MKDAEIRSMGADPRDYHRSTVAKRIFSLAGDNQLIFAHYEYRWPIPVPESWISERDRHSQGEVHWKNGVLSELKYQSFRHDSVVCNFHPGQSSKWGAHELCHKLVGYAWKKDGDLLFHTLAAWAAEVLPVTVYYFWDEIDCQKCSSHKDFSISPMTFCAACERFSNTTPNKRQDLVRAGWNFLNTQLQAIEASMKSNRLVTAPFMGLDLADDAYYYSLSQYPRMNSVTYQEYMEHMVPPQIYCSTIETFLQRIRLVAKAIMEEIPLSNYGLTRMDWMSLDVGFRALELSENMEETLQPQFLDHLSTYMTTKDISGFAAAYAELSEEFHLPTVEEFFGVGYNLHPNYGYHHQQVKDGIESLIPISMQQLSDVEIQNFLQQDTSHRDFLGFRLQKYFSEDILQIESFVNQPQSFFIKDYSTKDLTKKYQWSDRVRIYKGTESIDQQLGIEFSYFLLFKDTAGEILSYPFEPDVGEILLKSYKSQFYLADIKVPLDEMQFYVQNHMLVEAISED